MIRITEHIVDITKERKLLKINTSHRNKLLYYKTIHSN